MDEPRDLVGLKDEVYELEYSPQVIPFTLDLMILSILLIQIGIRSLYSHAILGSNKHNAAIPLPGVDWYINKAPKCENRFTDMQKTRQINPATRPGVSLPSFPVASP